MELYLDEFKVNDPANGVYLGDPVEGLAGLPGIRTSSGSNIGRDGGWTSKQCYDARFISFPVWIYGRSIADVEAKRREFASVLHKRRLTLRIVTLGGHEYVTNVVVLDAPAPITRIMNRIDYKINLRADDPILYDNTDGDIAAIIRKTVDGGFDIPFDIPLDISGGSLPTQIVNAGNETVKPIITIKTRGTNPQLINRTTDKMIKNEIQTNDGDELRIDMFNGIVMYNGLDVYGLRSAGSEFWGLVPGDNVVELVTDVLSEKTEAEVRYRSGSIGI